MEVIEKIPDSRVVDNYEVTHRYVDAQGAEESARKAAAKAKTNSLR